MRRLPMSATTGITATQSRVCSSVSVEPPARADTAPTMKAPPAVSYVRKPFDLDELLAVVERYVRRD